jgi:hypothetical protein
MVNQLKACFDFEIASSLSAEGRWLPTLFHLARSFWRVPRTTLHLRRLWRSPAAGEPAATRRSTARPQLG